MTKDVKATESPPKESDALGVFRAIAKITGELAKEGIAKDKKNDQQGYKFRGIDDVYNALAPRLADAGLIILPKVQERVVEVRQTKSGGALYNVTLLVEFHFICAEDGSREVITMYGEAMDSADKATNKALSAAYKYACIEAFCIPTRGEEDADETTPEETLPVASPPKPLLAPKVAQQASLDSYNERKAEYAIEAPILPDGTLDLDAFTAGMELALQGAASLQDVSMLKKANGKTLNIVQAERPDLWGVIKDEFMKAGNKYK
jgi:hypothetical protein